MKTDSFAVPINPLHPDFRSYSDLGWTDEVYSRLFDGNEDRIKAFKALPPHLQWHRKAIWAKGKSGGPIKPVQWQLQKDADGSGLRVTPNSAVRIINPQGTVCPGGGWPSFTPQGYMAGYGWGLDEIADAGFLVPNLNKFCLCVKIQRDQGSEFLIPRNPALPKHGGCVDFVFSWNYDKDGIVYAGVNDDDDGDNTGDFTAVIEYQPLNVYYESFRNLQQF